MLRSSGRFFGRYPIRFIALRPNCESHTERRSAAGGRNSANASACGVPPIDQDQLVDGEPFGLDHLERLPHGTRQSLSDEPSVRLLAGRRAVRTEQVVAAVEGDAGLAEE